MLIHQYANPVVTITKTTSQTGPAISVSGSDITKTGSAGVSSRSIQGYSSTSSTWTITADSEDSGTWYVKNTDINNAFETNTVIKKKIDRCGETGMTKRLVLDPLTTRTERSNDYKETTTTGDLQAGMHFYSKTEYTKTVKASLDKDNNVLDFETCKDKETDRVELSETNNLEEGMLAIYDDRAIGVIESIECSKTVKLSTKSYLTRSKNIVFKSESWGIISSIESLDNGGKTTVKVFPPVNIPDNATVEFDDNKTVMNASLRHSGSGTDTVTLTVTVDVEKFGYKDVQYTLDLDKLITRTPNAYDRRVTTAKETAVLIKMFEDDYDSNAKVL